MKDYDKPRRCQGCALIYTGAFYSWCTCMAPPMRRARRSAFTYWASGSRASIEGHSAKGSSTSSQPLQHSLVVHRHLSSSARSSFSFNPIPMNTNSCLLHCLSTHHFIKRSQQTTYHHSTFCHKTYHHNTEQHTIDHHDTGHPTTYKICCKRLHHITYCLHSASLLTVHTKFYHPRKCMVSGAMHNTLQENVNSSEDHSITRQVVLTRPVPMSTIILNQCWSPRCTLSHWSMQSSDTDCITSVQDCSQLHTLYAA